MAAPMKQTAGARCPPSIAVCAKVSPSSSATSPGHCTTEARSDLWAEAPGTAPNVSMCAGTTAAHIWPVNDLSRDRVIILALTGVMLSICNPCRSDAAKFHLRLIPPGRSPVSRPNLSHSVDAARPLGLDQWALGNEVGKRARRTSCFNASCRG